MTDKQLCRYCGSRIFNYSEWFDCNVFCSGECKKEFIRLKNQRNMQQLKLPDFIALFQ